MPSTPSPIVSKGKNRALLKAAIKKEEEEERGAKEEKNTKEISVKTEKKKSSPMLKLK